ncbi:PIN domain-containing protein [Umbelopsis sp. AD052]|nr:PIN domain-containing protein [Umbelopsis sp. AD052]
MHGDEDYMDEDGPEFISMINDLVRNVRTEITTHPHDTASASRLQINLQSPYSSSQSKYAAPSQSKHSALKYKSHRLGADNVKQSITTSRNLKKHLESLISTTSAQAIQEETFIVVDTNILISHQDHLKSLISSIERRQCCATVVVPWVVLEELDLLKSRREAPGSRVADRAQGAIIFLQKIFSSKSPALRGQQVIESSDTSAFENDDRILDCCRYFARKEHRRVVLYSNDRNLCNKCMVHHIDAFGSVDQHKLQTLVDNAQVRVTAHKKALSVSTPPAPSKSRSQTGVTEVMSQVQSRPSTSHRSTETTHKPRSYSIEGTSAADSIHAPHKSKSKRLQDATSRLDTKKEARSWNMEALERHRSKIESKDEPKPRTHTTEDRHHSIKKHSEPKPTLDDDDDCAMDVDDDYPPPLPKSSLDSIHARSHHY